MFVPKVSVLIPNFNGAELLEACLRSVAAQSHAADEIIVIDNGSEDDSRALVDKKFPSVKIINNFKNLGFAKAMNIGIRESKGDFILMLNNDVELTPGFIDELVRVITKNKNVGSAAGKLYRMKNGKPQYIILDSAGHIITINRLGRDRGYEQNDTGRYDREEDIFGPCAAAGLYKREMLEDLKDNGEYFDEAFISFREDIDLNWRAQLRGWRCIYTPNAVGHHHRSATSTKSDLIRATAINNYKNWYFCIFKNDSFLNFLKGPKHYFKTCLGKTYQVAWKKRMPDAVIIGYILMLLQLPSILQKRFYIQRRRLVSDEEFKKWEEPAEYK